MEFVDEKVNEYVSNRERERDYTRACVGVNACACVCMYARHS